jgi:heme oxygenase
MFLAVKVVEYTIVTVALGSTLPGQFLLKGAVSLGVSLSTPAESLTAVSQERAPQ